MPSHQRVKCPETYLALLPGFVTTSVHARLHGKHFETIRESFSCGHGLLVSATRGGRNFNPLGSTWISQSLSQLDGPLPQAHVEREFRLEFTNDEALWKTHLATAMVSVSGRNGTPEEALLILNGVPLTIRKRMWIVYKASVEEDRFFHTHSLYTAPDPRDYMARVSRQEEAAKEVVDQSMKQLEAKFGAPAVREAQGIERQIFEDAKRRTVSRPVTWEAPDGNPWRPGFRFASQNL